MNASVRVLVYSGLIRNFTLHITQNEGIKKTRERVWKFQIIILYQFNVVHYHSLNQAIAFHQTTLQLRLSILLQTIAINKNILLLY